MGGCGCVCGCVCGPLAIFVAGIFHVSLSLSLSLSLEKRIKQNSNHFWSLSSPNQVANMAARRDRELSSRSERDPLRMCHLKTFHLYLRINSNARFGDCEPLFEEF